MLTLNEENTGNFDWKSTDKMINYTLNYTLTGSITFEQEDKLIN